MITQSDRPAGGPVQVVLVSTEHELPVFTAARPDGTRWSGVWLVVLAGGEPAGLVEVAYAGRDVIPAEEVARVVKEGAHGARPRGLALRDSELPRASVVVASNLARPEQLRTCLTALTSLDYPDFELIVVDNHRGPDGDGLLEDIVAGLPGVRTVREAIPGTSAARNAGARAATGEIIAFTDDDVRVDPGWLRAIGTRFALRPEEDLVTGLILPTDLETDAQMWFERHYGGFGGVRAFAPLSYRGAGDDKSTARRAEVKVLNWAGQEVRTFTVYGAGVAGAGANMAFRAQALQRLGGFDLSLGPGTPARGGEDLVLFIDHLWKGGAIGYEPAAMVFHTHRAEYSALRQQLYNYGLGYTALLTALIVADPRHVLGLAARLPIAFRTMRAERAARMERNGAGTPTRHSPVGRPAPEELAKLERRGSLRGPVAYAHSRLTARRRRRLGAAAH